MKTKIKSISGALRDFGRAAFALSDALDEGAERGAGANGEAVAAPEEAPEVVEVSYISGRPLAAPSVDVRRRSRASAKAQGFNLIWWAGRVRQLEQLGGCDRATFAELLGVGSSTVGNWQSGLTFANRPNRARLVAVGKALRGWPASVWATEPPPLWGNGPRDGTQGTEATGGLYAGQPDPARILSGAVERLRNAVAS